MIKITNNLKLHSNEVKITFMRAPGPGGQNVNKVATAVQLRFNVLHSMSLPEDVRARLVTLIGNRLTHTGDLIIKATRCRTQERNKQDALNRLSDMIKHALTPPKKRKKTKPTTGSKERRLTKKKLHSKIKALRRINNPKFDS